MFSGSREAGRGCASTGACLELIGNQTVCPEQVENDLSLALVNSDIIFWHFKYSVVYFTKTLAIHFFSRFDKIGLFPAYIN